MLLILFLIVAAFIGFVPWWAGIIILVLAIASQPS